MARLKNTVKFDCANLLIVCHFSFHYEMAKNKHLQDLKILSDAYFKGSFYVEYIYCKYKEYLHTQVRMLTAAEVIQYMSEREH